MRGLGPALTVLLIYSFPRPAHGASASTFPFTGAKWVQAALIVGKVLGGAVLFIGVVASVIGVIDFFRGLRGDFKELGKELRGDLNAIFDKLDANQNELLGELIAIRGELNTDAKFAKMDAKIDELRNDFEISQKSKMAS